MTNFAYTPILRWKRGEQGALRYLEAADRKHMLPIVEIQLLERGAAQPILERQLIQWAGKTFPVGIDLAAAYEAANFVIEQLAMKDKVIALQELARLYLDDVLRHP